MPSFTAQEMTIIRSTVDGLGDREIGALINLSCRTVRYHFGQIFDKCGFSGRDRCRVKLVVYAFRNKLVS